MRRRPSVPSPLFPLRGKSIAMKWLHTRVNRGTFASTSIEHQRAVDVVADSWCDPRCTPALQVVIEVVGVENAMKERSAQST